MSVPTFQEIKQTLEDLGKANHEFREANDRSIAEIKKGNETLAREFSEKADKFNKEVGTLADAAKKLSLQLDVQNERIEELESRAKSPGKTIEQKRRDDHKGAFNAWMRQPSPMTESNLKQAENKLIEMKDVTIGTGAQGGFAVPEEISREIGRLERLKSPVRRLVKVVQAGTSDYKELVSKRGTTAGWVGETGTRSATLTSQLRERAMTHGELYAYPQASEWSLDDIFFNVEAWLAEEVADRFAEEEGIAVISGNGTSKPTGMINTAPVTTADFASPERAAAAYQSVTTDLTPGGVSILPDDLITLAATLHSVYRGSSTWVMNSLTAATIRKLKETTNQYLWQPGLQMGTPDILLGRPVEIWENMPAIGANNFPVALGDWRRAYYLADRVGLRITRDNVTNVGFVRFYVRRREGGIVLDNHAAKFLQTL
jgi:HK97 family phage major capsid protein